MLAPPRSSSRPQAAASAAPPPTTAFFVGLCVLLHLLVQLTDANVGKYAIAPVPVVYAFELNRIVT